MPNPIYQFADSNKNHIHFLPFMMKKGLQSICVMQVGQKFYVLKSDEDGHEFFLDPITSQVLQEEDFESFQKEHESKGFKLVFDYSKNIFNPYKSKWTGNCNFTASEMEHDAVLLPCRFGMCEGKGRSDRTLSFQFKSLKDVNQKPFDKVAAEEQRKSLISFMEMDHSIKIPYHTEKSWNLTKVMEDLKKIATMDGVESIPKEKAVLNSGVGSYGLDVRNALWYATRHSDIEMFSYIVDRYDILSRLPMSHIDMIADCVKGSEEFATMFVEKMNLSQIKNEDRPLSVIMASMANKWTEIEQKATGVNQKKLFDLFFKSRKDLNAYQP